MTTFNFRKFPADDTTPLTSGSLRLLLFHHTMFTDCWELGLQSRQHWTNNSRSNSTSSHPTMTTQHCSKQKLRAYRSAIFKLKTAPTCLTQSVRRLCAQPPYTFEAVSAEQIFFSSSIKSSVVSDFGYSLLLFSDQIASSVALWPSFTMGAAVSDSYRHLLGVLDMLVFYVLQFHFLSRITDSCQTYL